MRSAVTFRGLRAREVRAIRDGGDPHILGPGLLPTPFTADEIRAGCPDGRAIRMRVEADGVVVAFRTNVFSNGDAEGATLESRRFGPDGTPAGAPDAQRVTWLELQAHASFPADRATVEPELLETSLGTLDCLRYTVEDEDGSTSEFWFARSAPGMPIRYRSITDGRVTSEVLVVENVMPRA